MFDFKESFNAGMSVAEKAEENHHEINQVFDELNKQLDEISEGKIEIDIREFSIPDNPLNVFGKRETYLSICARNPKSEMNSWKQLARWEQDSFGYPCKIKIDQATRFCGDQEALSDALSEMLSNVDVAKTLRALITIPSSGEEF
tara:strand:+ start:3909 stop:4343 length:435 start_codon:yes stop_codon:yes gene_type:complete